MKTLKEFKNFIDESGGTLEFGEFKISHDKTDTDEYHDIDISFGDLGLIAWIRGSGDQSKKLTDVDVTIHSTFGNKLNEVTENISGKDKGPDLKEENDNLKEKVEQLEEINSNLTIDTGKVEAYEKILIGREVTIGK